MSLEADAQSTTDDTNSCSSSSLEEVVNLVERIASVQQEIKLQQQENAQKMEAYDTARITLKQQENANETKKIASVQQENANEMEDVKQLIVSNSSVLQEVMNLVREIASNLKENAKEMKKIASVQQEIKNNLLVTLLCSRKSRMR